MLDNEEIVSKNLDLIEKCIQYQFQSIKEKWKKQYKEDFHNDLVLSLLEYDNEKLNDAYENNHLNALITRIIQNNIYSKTSPFYKRYVRFNKITDDIDGYDEPEN